MRRLKLFILWATAIILCGIYIGGLNLKQVSANELSIVQKNKTVNDYSKGTPIIKTDKAHIAQKGETLDAKYNFVPKFNGSGATVVDSIGTEVNNSLEFDNKTNKIVNLSKSKKGKVGFKYSNIGWNNDDQSIDLKIIFTDWGRLSQDGDATIAASKNAISTTISGAGWLDYEYEYVIHGTDTPANVSGLLTFTDIDAGQNLEFSNSNWNKINTIFVPQSQDSFTGKFDNWLRLTHDNDYYLYMSPKASSQDTDKFAMMTLTYSDKNSITFRADNGGNGNASLGHWGINYIAQKPIATETMAPKLKVLSKDNEPNTSITLEKNQNTVDYQISQKIPAEWQEYYYKNIKLAGTLPGTIKNISVVNDKGTDVTNYFSNKSKTNKVDLEATSLAKANADFYDHMYTIIVKIASPEDTEKIDTFTNNISTTIDGNTKKSNSVKTTLANKHDIIIHYYKKGSKTKIAKDKVITVKDGDKYSIAPAKIPGYIVTTKGNKTGVYKKGTTISFFYTIKKEKVTIKYMYYDKGNFKDVDEYDSDVITGNYGEKYYAKPADMLSNAGDWILDTSRLPKNAKETFTDKDQTVYYYYITDHDREIEHKDGSDTYIDITADNRTGMINENFSDGVEIEIQRDDFSKNNYEVNFFDKNDDLTKTVTVKFGETITMKIGNSYYQVTISKNGNVTVNRITSGKKLVVESFSVSHDGKKETHSSKNIAYSNNKDLLNNIKKYMGNDYSKTDINKYFEYLLGKNTNYSSVELAILNHPEILGITNVKDNISKEITKPTIVNKKNSKINKGLVPHLNGKDNPLLIVAGIIILAGVLIYFIVKRNKKEGDK